MSADPVGVGIVGLGYWGPNRLRALGGAPGVALRSICDKDPERLSRWAARHSGVVATSDFSDMLSDPGVDAILIATPALSHYTLVKEALAAGKHVFVEKPIARSRRETEELIELATDQSLVLMCGFTFLYSPPVRLIKRLLDEGQLGQLYFVSSTRVNLGPYRSDVNVIFDLGAHDFSIFRYWLDAPPVRVNAVGRDVISKGVADVAFVDLAFAGGAIGHVELSWLSPSKLRRTVLVGSEKMIVYEDGSPEPVRLFDSGIEYRDPETFGEYHLSYRTGDIVSMRVDSTEPIVAELQDFIGAVRGGPPPLSDHELAIDVIATVEAAEASLAQDGSGVAVVRDPGRAD